MAPSSSDDICVEHHPTAIDQTTVTKLTGGSKGPPLEPPPFEVSICSVQGGRPYMEDECFVSQKHDFAAVFDGHGGSAVSKYLRQNLYAHVQASLLPPKTPNLGKAEGEEESISTASSVTEEENSSTTVTTPSIRDYEEALCAALAKVDQEVQRVSHWSYQGSTAVVVWVHEDTRPTASASSMNKTIITANVGDSRAVLSRNGTAVELTHDHKPEKPYEREQVEARGGEVVWCGLTNDNDEPIKTCGVYRVNGNLAVSRSIGDRSERPAITSEAETDTLALERSDAFIVLATDGLWDVMSSQEVVRFVHNKLRASITAANECFPGGGGGSTPRSRSFSMCYPLNRTSSRSIDIPEEEDPAETLQNLQRNMAKFLVDESLRRKTMDNVSVVIVWLR